MHRELYHYETLILAHNLVDIVPRAYYPRRPWRAYESNPCDTCFKYRSIDARSVYSRRAAHCCIGLVDVPMKNAHTLENVGKRNWQMQIDEETWMELTFLFERVVDTLGVIAPVLDLAKNKNATEKMRHLRAVADLAFRGQRALKAFGQRWALVQEENRKRPPIGGMEDFADIFQAAQQIPSPNPQPNSDSVIAEATHDLS